MGQELAKSTLATVGPSITSRVFSDLLAWHQSGVTRYDGGFVETTRPPTEPARRVMVARLTELRASINATPDKQAIAVAVGELMSAYRSTGRVGEGEAKAAITAYVKVLVDRPVWAVRRACEQIARGQVEGVSLDFPPAAPRLRDVVNRLLEPFFVEASQIRECLNAQIKRNPDPAERARLGQLFANLAAELRGNAAAMDKRKPAKAPELGAFAETDF